MDRVGKIMAELAKKLHLKKGSTEHTAKAYTVVGEAGSEYIINKIDGITCYVAIGSVDDERATMARLTKNGTKAILKSGKPPYSEQSYTTPGTHTFTVPKYINRIKYAICGAGSGAMGRGQYEAWAGGGGSSSINDIVATGGSDGYLDIDGTFRQQKAGTPNGRKGEIAYERTNDIPGETHPAYPMGKEMQGGKGWELNFNAQEGTYGKGGNGRTWNFGTAYTHGRIVCGASGGYKTGYLDVTEQQTITVKVGGGGSGYWRGDGGNSNVDNGANGFVLIAWGGDI